jgi:hypothetical protein
VSFLEALPLALLWACAHAPVVEPAPPPVRLVTVPDRALLAELAPADAARVETILTQMRPSEGWAAIPAPWDAALVVDGERGGERVLRLVGLALRENRQDPWALHLAGPDGIPDPAVQDYQLEEQDQEWLWALFERHLGPTDVKQYQGVGFP